MPDPLDINPFYPEDDEEEDEEPSASSKDDFYYETKRGGEYDTSGSDITPTPVPQRYTDEY